MSASRHRSFTGVSSLQDLAARTGEAVRDLDDALSAMPRVRVKQYETQARWPETVQVQGLTQAPVAVVLGKVHAVGNPASPLLTSTLHWHWGESGALVVDQITGLTAGTAYAVSLVIFEAGG